MSPEETMLSNAADLLEPDETLEAVFSAQTKSPWVYLLATTWVILLTKGYCIVVVTDRRILVCRARGLMWNRVDEVLRELPRGTRIGVPSGKKWWRCDSLGERMYVHERMQGEIVAADDALAGEE